jgi:hypothetical protein
MAQEIDALRKRAQQWINENETWGDPDELLDLAEPIIRDLLAALKAQQGETAWRSMDEAPMDGSHVLLADVAGTVAEGYWLEGVGLWLRANTSIDDESSVVIVPAHWQPLPAAPEAVK